MNNRETFRSRIAPAILGLASMSDLDAFRAIGQFCHTFCDQATTAGDLVKVSGGSADLGWNMDKFENNEGGGWCGELALMCAQMLNASGRVDKAWYYAEGIALNATGPFQHAWYDDDSILLFTHATTLASINGVLYNYDPYLNGEYVDDRGEIMPYLDVLRAIKERRPPRWRQHFAEKDIHAIHLNNLEGWNDEVMNPVQYRLKQDAPGSQRVLGRGIITARSFRKNYFQKDHIDQALIRLGYPAEPDEELWHYLKLHPIHLANSDYGDPDASKDEVFKQIQSVVSS